jgi:hypothetical protein
MSGGLAGRSSAGNACRKIKNHERRLLPAKTEYDSGAVAEVGRARDGTNYSVAEKVRKAVASFAVRWSSV